MTISKFLNRLVSSNHGRKRIARISPAANIESLEAKQVLSASALFLTATGELNIVLNSNDSVRVSASNGNVLVETSTGTTFTPVSSVGDVPAASVRSLVILGGDDANTIDLSGVLAAQFTSLTSISVDGANGNDLLIGSPDIADSLIGGHGADTLRGNGGNDTLLGGDGDDSISGGSGDDSINAGDGDDSVNADDGNDSINAGNGQDTVSGGNGNDTIGGANGQDSLSGDAGDDSINGDGGTDTIDGGDGNDSILGGELNDSLSGGNGNDTINGQAGDDIIDAGAGNDSLLGGDGNDAISGDDGDDIINGNSGNDTVRGGNGNDQVLGGGGNDSINGNGGDDTVQGQSGNDTVIGGGGNDVVDGGDGNDLVETFAAQTLPAAATTVSISDANPVVEGASPYPTLFNAPATLATPSDSNFVAVADFNGDGVPDIATNNSVILNNGNGTFGAAIPFTSSGGSGFMSAGDANGDGKMDLLIPSNNGRNGGGADLLFGNGNGTFQAPINLSTGDFFGSPAARLADLNGDGALDVVVAGGFATTHVSVFLNNGNGTFGPLTNYSVDQRFGNANVVAADVDGDGRQDLIVALDVFSQRVAVLRNAGSGQFLSPVFYTVGATTNGLAVGDLNGDGAIDIAVTERGGANQVLVNNGLGSFAIGATFNNGALFSNSVAMADVDNDGDLDLVTSQFGGNASMFINDGSANFQGPFNFAIGSFNDDLALADFDQDGRVDLLMANGFGQRSVAVARNTGLPANFAVFTVSLNQPSSVPVTVNYTTGAGNATAVSDYLPSSGTVTFAPGVTTQTVRVQIIGDNTPEPNENFFVTLSAPVNAVLGASVAQGTILDDDGGPATPTITIGNASATEGDIGTTPMTFTVTLSAAQAAPVSIDYSTLDGSARAGFDYTAASGTITFVPGVLSQTITVNVIGDEFAEGNETFFVKLGVPPTGLLLTSSRATGTIVDNEPALSLTDHPTLLGGNGNDTLIGSDLSETLNGGGGDDSILAGAGDDLLFGGAGNDTLDGQAGDDTIDGQGGDDVIFGGDGDDTFVMGNGAGGQDTVDGGDGFNGITANGTNAADTISIDAPSGFIRIVRGSATITASANVQSVGVNGLGGNDLITINNLSGVLPTVLLVNGGEGNDTLTAAGTDIGRVRLFLSGDNGNDVLIGSLGNDSILGGNGNDSVNGGAGNDSIQGQAGNDILAGGIGNDTITGGDGLDSLTGQAGDDSLDGGTGNDTLRGFEGNDTLLGQSGDDLLNGMDGDDSILGGVGKDSISGGAGNDTLDGGRNDDSINGNSGNDKIRGDHGNDYIDAGTGNDTVNGGDGNDTILATDGGDLLNGGDGDDHINAGGGNDIIVGGDGNDTLLGGGGGDVILGGDGDDDIDGQGGTDTIAGNQGLDVIVDPASEIDESFVLSAAIIALLDAI